jgi:hypothetical protein
VGETVRVSYLPAGLPNNRVVGHAQRCAGFPSCAAGIGMNNSALIRVSPAYLCRSATHFDSQGLILPATLLDEVASVRQIGRTEGASLRERCLRQLEDSSAGYRYPPELLQLRVLCFGLPQNWDVRISTRPGGKKVLVFLP